jgi:hypothetical protein
MALNIVNILSTTVAWLKTHNSTTTGISKNLTKEVQNFYQGVEGFHNQMASDYEKYPIVCLEAVNDTEDWSALGNTARRWIDFNFDVVCITQLGAGADVEGYGREKACNEIMRLTLNIKEFLKTNISLSNTVEWQQPVSTDYNTTEGDNFYNYVSKISCHARILST